MKIRSALVVLHHVGQARQTLLAQQPEGTLLQPQPSLQGIGLKFEVVARGADHVVVSAPDAGNGQTFVDGGDRQFLLGANARALLRVSLSSETAASS